MVLPIGPLIGGGLSLVNALMGRGAAQDANNINWQSLFETRRRNRETEKMAKATRTDAFGNKTVYTPGVGWEIDTTPMVEAILGSQQNEELRQLREDAPRNRAAAERKDARSRLGDEEFTKRFNEFRFRPQRNEEAEISDVTRALLGARKKGLDESSSLVARQLMRTGGSADLANIFKTANDQYAGSLEDAILKGRQLGKQSFASEEAGDLQRGQSELGFLKGISDDTTTSPVGMPADRYNSELTSGANNAMQQLIQAMQQGTASNQAASNAVARSTAGTALDLSGVANAFGGMDFSGPSEKDQVELETARLRQALLMQKLGMGMGGLGGGGAVQTDPSTPLGYDPWAGLRNVGRNQFFG